MISTMTLMTWTTKGRMTTSTRTISTRMTIPNWKTMTTTKHKKPEEPKEKGAFVVRDDDDDDNLTPSGNPKRRVIAAGATADPVKDYLKQIGRVNLLNAEQEVDLSGTHRGRSVRPTSAGHGIRQDGFQAPA